MAPTLVAPPPHHTSLPPPRWKRVPAAATIRRMANDRTTAFNAQARRVLDAYRACGGHDDAGACGNPRCPGDREFDRLLVDHLKPDMAKRLRSFVFTADSSLREDTEQEILAKVLCKLRLGSEVTLQIATGIYRYAAIDMHDDAEKHRRPLSLDLHEGLDERLPELGRGTEVGTLHLDLQRIVKEFLELPESTARHRRMLDRRLNHGDTRHADVARDLGYPEGTVRRMWKDFADYVEANHHDLYEQYISVQTTKS